MQYLEEVLETYKFDIRIKNEQKQCIQHLLNDQNVLAMLPTGFGKSLIYTLFVLMKSKVILHSN